MIHKASATVGYVGSGASLVFGLTPGEWQAVGVMGGLFFAFCGFAFNAWLGWRRDQREERGK